jgi:methylenetetrahydrofolate dehydrogenase (NADP+)/methenyltetrahydrofolate cyclohydrolase
MKNTSKIIDGVKIAEAIKDLIVPNIFANGRRRPSLAIILVGERPDSELYVSLKEREAVRVGIDTHLYRLDNDSTEVDLLSVIDFLNKDEMVDAILLQLPLPASFNTDKMIAAIDPLKDADGFHPQHPDYIISPVIAAVDFIAKDYKVTGRACVFHRSDIFGESLKNHLQKIGFMVDLLAIDDQADPRTDQKLKDRLSAVSSQADLVVTALGLPEFLTSDYLKKDALVIDVGIKKENGKIKGDVDFEDASKIAAGITPVPGGVGPMTIAFLFKNVLEIYYRR